MARMSLTGKVVVVIGGTSGIGLATAERALGTGARVASDAVAASLPVKRVGAAEDVAQTVLDLLTNGYSTGTVVDVDGGHRLI
jgi:NAD(P)-dependent dehydrogenase (short-subunit alcohol dehydrogenase family)